MKKVIIVIFSIILLVTFTNFINAAPKFYFLDDFESYVLGYNTTQPVWIPQYSSRVGIQQNYEGKHLSIDSFSPYQGDRDVHVTYNKLFYPLNKEKISLSWDFTVTSCNQTWKAVKGISPQASTGYLYYNNPQDFISSEFKVYSNSTSCGSGIAQISVFKRINGTSTALIPYTTYTFEINKTYDSQLILERINSTSYKISVYLNNNLMASSSKISYNELKQGYLLLENGGTITSFDNAAIKVYR